MKTRSASGFTLVELLVVVVLVALLGSIGLVTVGTGNQERELHNEASRLHAVLRMASEEAVFSNTEIGVRVDNKGYDFLVYSEQDAKWEAAAEFGFLKAYELPEWLMLDFQREGELRSLGKAAQGDQGLDESAGEASGMPDTPDFMLLSSGEVTPFVIGLEIEGKSDSRLEIKTDDQGDIVIPALAREDD